MDKISLMVKDLLLRWPSLYSNRFTAFADLMTNSSWDWDPKTGELVVLMDMPGEATPESMVASYRRDLAEAEAKYPDAKGEAHGPGMKALYAQFRMAALRDLLVAEHIATNVDVYASTWCGVGTTHPMLWLLRADRYGIAGKYGAINNLPANLDSEWREAIRNWLHQIMPVANSMFGMCDIADPRAPWRAIPRYAATFDWLQGKLLETETEEHRKRGREQAKLSKQIVDEILAEEAAAKGERNGPV